MIRALRSFLFVSVQFATALLYTPVALLAMPLPAVLRSRIISGWAHFIVWWLRISCGLRHEVHGLGNMPPGPGVILSKHQSAWETIAFQTIFPPQAWVLKRELLWVPFFGWGLAASRPIAIDRSAGVRALDKVVRDGIDRLRGGRWIVVFPEGTRTNPGKRGRYNPGGAMLAVKAQVPVVPVAHNAGVFWPRRGFLKIPGVIQVKVGPPIATQGRRPKQVATEAEEWIEQAMASLPVSPSRDPVAHRPGDGTMTRSEN